MRVFIYEFVTGGGWWSMGSQPPPGSLLAEGRAMLKAVSSDFARLPGVQVATLVDSRLARSCDNNVACEMADSAVAERHLFERQAASSDWTLLIAPELDGHLLARCQWVLAAGGRLLSPSPEVVALASDKHATARHLAERGVPVVRGMLIEAGHHVPNDFFPAVLKPQFGCGSIGIQTLATSAELECLSFAGSMRLERFVPGLPASVAVLCGPAQALALPACAQVLSDDGRFTYLGGRLPLEPQLDRRALELAAAVAKSLPEPLGYLGIDLVLGDDPTGGDDRIIEINPRLTTSYVGLRALARENLAAAMLDVAHGQPCDLSWRDEAIEFSADGQVQAAKATRQR